MDIAARIEELKRKLAAREHIEIYRENCEEIRKEIARLEALLGGG